MNLLLDEHWSKKVAEQLRQKGYDVTALKETDLADQRIPDETVLRWAIGQRRVVVTYDVHTFPSILQEFAERREEHYGIVLVSSATIPQGDTGAQVRALEHLLAENPAEESLYNTVRFLEQK